MSQVTDDVGIWTKAYNEVIQKMLRSDFVRSFGEVLNVEWTTFIWIFFFWIDEMLHKVIEIANETFSSRNTTYYLIAKLTTGILQCDWKMYFIFHRICFYQMCH